MAKVLKKIGRLPISLGDWTEGKFVPKDLLVQHQNCTWQAKVDTYTEPSKTNPNYRLYAGSPVVQETGYDNQSVISQKEVTETFGYNDQNPEFLRVITDNDGRILFALHNDGSVDWARGIPAPIKEALSVIEESIAEKGLEITSAGEALMGIIANLQAGLLGKIEENHEFDSLTLDSENRILESRQGNKVREYSDKTIKGDVEVKGNVTVDNLTVNEDIAISTSAANSIMSSFKEAGLSLDQVVDWSESSFMQIPQPRCAKLNILYDGNLSNISKASRFRTTSNSEGVSYNIPVQVEFWDMQGNYFKKWCLMSGQGDSSMSFIKKNIALDFYNSYEDAINDDSAFEMRIGSWVTQKSFHMKAYYTDYFRGVGKVAYDLCEEVAQTRPFNDLRPYRYLHRTDNVSSIGLDTEKDLDLNINASPKCFPLGFPVLIYQNGNFWGVYSWQLKKNRDNYAMNKKNKNHIHLDGYLSYDSIWLGNINWTKFEVRNPGKDAGVKYAEPHNIHGVETDKYDGDFPYEIAEGDVKTSIIRLSRYIPNLYYITGDPAYGTPQDDGIYIGDQLEAQVAREAYQAASTNEEKRAIVKESISRRFNVSFFIDFLLNANVTGNSDEFNKNWQWTTWDGVLWTPNIYDCDMSFGGHFLGNRVTVPTSGWLGNTKDSPSGWMYVYFGNELKERYAQLRDLGIYDAKHMTNLLKEWCERIGYDNFKSEYKKWNESPCNRPSNIDTEHWTTYVEGRISDVTAWTSAQSVSTNAFRYYNNKVYMALATNSGKNPESYPDVWKEITYNPLTNYTTGDIAAYGSSIDYQFAFRCVSDCVGCPPLTSFYNSFPRDLGSFNSLERVYNWLVAKIGYMDNLLYYNN